MAIDVFSTPSTDSYSTHGGIVVHRLIEEIPVEGATEPITTALDDHKGLLFASDYEYPGRYTRWDMGFIDPPLEVTSRGRAFRVPALNERGRVVLTALAGALRGLPAVERVEVTNDVLSGTVEPPSERFPEEQRSKQPSVFSVLRVLLDLFYSPAEPHLGLYGAFGYDLAFQFEPIRPRLQRPAEQRDLVLYLPDELVVVDHRRERNPAPYGFLMNLGETEYLVGASPEMFVRVQGDRVETCPISGTIARGPDPISDAARILELLNSDKDEAELTMCTDVDRNDKSRICVPGTVRVIGRRQIEMYSRVIHTVDHVEGLLRPGYDAIDAFLAHAWAVTVTGAPKVWAMQFIEDHERSPRVWYGGGGGVLGVFGE